MPRLYLPLVPVTLLALLAAASACRQDRGEEGDTLRVVPPPAVVHAPAPAPLLASAGLARAAPAEPEPSAEEVRAFEATVSK